MSLGDTIENKMKTQMEWSLLPDKGTHSTVIPSNIFSSYLDFPKFPVSYNKISRIAKINKELSELKKIFPNYSLFEIQNIVGPLFFNIVIDKLVNEGKNGIDKIVDIFASFGMNANLFKENLLDFQSKENQNIYNKISRMTKINKELNELKKIFPNYSLFEIQNIVGPLFFNIVIDKLVNEGKNGIDEIVDIFAHFGMNANLFKENLLDFQSKENQNIYNKINNSIKTSLTKKLNERFKTSVKPHKTRTIMMPQIKVDKDGNLLDDYDEDDVDEEEADDQSSSIFEPIKKVNKKKKN
jgi:regulator of sigma D